MKHQDSEFWTRASQAREDLASQLKDDPTVCFVDIGYPYDVDAQQDIALRIHACDGDGGFPTEVDGIPVVVARGQR